ncbi:hypothetical protein EVAR_45473_1 [Eumeta japonica]|uniref:Uncharacterized protein n=1 Tax=Eumeta variegata TaxID=151549 RepID=A0A4C1WH98_EUMVA|nr:hypothetical protein EVAR_45473_1 [Eumeta japonica]
MENNAISDDPGRSASAGAVADPRLRSAIPRQFLRSFKTTQYRPAVANGPDLVKYRCRPSSDKRHNLVNRMTDTRRVVLTAAACDSYIAAPFHFVLRVVCRSTAAMKMQYAG